VTTTTEQLSFLDHFETLRDAGAIDDLGLDLAALGEMSLDEWEALGVYLGRGNSAFRWAIGDWLNFGERSYAEEYAQGMEATGLSLSTLRSYAAVAAAVARVRRRTDVSWSQHEAVSTLSPSEQRRWLARIAREGWTVERTREERRSSAADESGEGLGEVSPTEKVTLSDAARSVWLNSSRHGEVFHVPVEAMLRLARAIGERV